MRSRLAATATASSSSRPLQSDQPLRKQWCVGKADSHQDVSSQGAFKFWISWQQRAKGLKPCPQIAKKLPRKRMFQDTAEDDLLVSLHIVVKRASPKQHTSKLKCLSRKRTLRMMQPCLLARKRMTFSCDRLADYANNTTSAKQKTRRTKEDAS